MRIMLLMLGAVAAAGCSRSTPPVPDAAPPIQLPAVAASSVRLQPLPVPSGPATEVPRVTMSFSGHIGKSAAFAMELERAGDRASGILTSEGRSHPVRLRGTWRNDGAITLDEVTAKGGSHIEAKLKGTSLTGTWKDKKSKASQTLSAGPLVPFPHEKDFAQAFVGTLGKATRIRARLEKKGLSVSGAYRYARSRDDLKLSGTVVEDTGKAALTETDAKGAITGRFEATFLTPALLTGTWMSPDGARVLPVTLERAEAYPEKVVLSIPDAPGASMAPQESYDQASPFCSCTVFYPQIDGLKAAAKKALNQSLQQAAGPAKMDRAQCEGATEETPVFEEGSWSISRSKGRFIGVVFSTYSSGGAHPSFSSECRVANTSSGQLFKLSSLVSAEARAKLNKLVTERLRATHKVQDLTEIGFYQDPIDLGAEPDLCLTEDGGMKVQIDPYEVAPYVVGDQEVAVSAAEARPLVTSPDADELFPLH
ncbi:MAG: DUF3298 domain-containing protein [Deltaproteobacteria bacterium]|nr:DUF3298 domain-containing protein [Deltaproteobacteria bacterium]